MSINAFTLDVATVQNREDHVVVCAELKSSHSDESIAYRVMDIAVQGMDRRGVEATATTSYAIFSYEKTYKFTDNSICMRFRIPKKNIAPNTDAIHIRFQVMEGDITGIGNTPVQIENGNKCLIASCLNDNSYAFAGIVGTEKVIYPERVLDCGEGGSRLFTYCRDIDGAYQLYHFYWLKPFAKTYDITVPFP